MNSVQAYILAVIEGLTEYLPISSTGHIILGSWMMGIHQEEFVKDYTIMVQFGAILSVVLLYWKRFVLNFKIYPKVAIAFLPAAIVGLLAKQYVDILLGSVWVVGISLLVGGVLLVATDHWIRRTRSKIKEAEKLPPFSAFKVGLFQLLAFIPGVSRSAASIWGGLYEGMSLKLATEFSFFLAVPTLTGASLLKLIKAWPELTGPKIEMLLWGNAISFVVGAVAIKGFIQIIANYGLRYFGYYRIGLGLIVLAVLISGQELTL